MGQAGELGGEGVYNLISITIQHPDFFFQAAQILIMAASTASHWPQYQVTRVLKWISKVSKKGLHEDANILRCWVGFGSSCATEVCTTSCI